MTRLARQAHGLETVAVVGGGIAGLATAIALTRIGLAVTVFERTPSYAPEGIFLSLFPNGIRFLRALDGQLAAEVEGAAVEQHSACVRTHDGTVIAERPVDFRERFGLPLLGVRWSALHDALRARVPASALCMGKRVVGAVPGERGVLLRFDDGSEHGFDLVVAADGVHSLLRRLFVDDEPSYAGRLSCRALVVPPAGERLHGVSMERSTGHTFASGELGDGRVFWNAMLNVRAEALPHEPTSAKTALLSAYAGFHGWAKALIEHTPAESMLVRPILVRAPLSSMQRGRLVILGDAAHAMQISTGQGANLALEEAVDLASCLAQAGSLEARLSAFDGRRVERAQLVHARNAMVSNAAHGSEGQTLMKGIVERARMDELEFQRFLHTYAPSAPFA